MRYVKVLATLLILPLLVVMHTAVVMGERVYVFDISVGEGGVAINVTGSDRISIVGYNDTKLLVTDFIEGVTSSARLFDMGTTVVPYARIGNMIVGKLGDGDGFIFNGSKARVIRGAPCYDIVNTSATTFYVVCGSYIVGIDNELNILSVRRVPNAVLSGIAVIGDVATAVGTLNGDTGIVVLLTPTGTKVFEVEAPSYLSDVCIYNGKIYAVGGVGDDVLILAIDPSTQSVAFSKILEPKSPAYVTGCVASSTDLWISAQIASFLRDTGGQDVLLIRVVDTTPYGYVLGSPSDDLLVRKSGLWINGTEICITFATYEKPNAPNIFAGCLPPVAQATYFVNEKSYFLFTPTDLTNRGSATVTVSAMTASTAVVTTEIVTPAPFSALIRTYYVYEVGASPGNVTATVIGGWAPVRGWELDRSSQVLFDTLMATVLTVSAIAVLVLGYMHGWRSLYIVAILAILGISIALAVARAAIPTKVELVNGEYHYVYERNSVVQVYLAPIMVSITTLIIALAFRMSRVTYEFA